jgi:CBS domain-containing protein
MSEGFDQSEIPYVPDGLFEEEQIMAERAARPKTLNSHTLCAPLSTLGLERPIIVAPHERICDAVEKMQRDSNDCVLVAQAGVLVGIFTERDILVKLAGKGLDWKTEQVAGHMTGNPETLSSAANMAFALNVMATGGFRHVPIVDEAMHPVAVVSMKDVVKYLTSFFEEEVVNLPPRPGLLHPRTREGG